MNEAYFHQLAGTVDRVIANLTAQRVEPNRLIFGGQGAAPSRKPSVPTDARSEFLANRAMGDWAEQKLANALTVAIPQFKVVQYGDTNRIAASDRKFREQYLAGLEETRMLGKRPDLLLFDRKSKVASDISSRPQAETEAIIKDAIAAIEVRSSKFEALTYMKVREHQRAAGNKTGRESPSFTVKVEDLVIVYRWLERNRVPQIYCQVFFDSIFAINFLDIFKIIASGGKGYCIETPAKSQEKATIMIPITAGLQIGTARSMPTFSAEHRVTALGRHDAYVVPQGGEFILESDKIQQVLG